MKTGLFLTFALLLFCPVTISGQDPIGIKSGVTREQNLQALVNPSLYSTTSGFDDRYEGVKGSPRLMDTLVPSTLTLKGQREPFFIETDIDVVRNTMLYLLRTSGDLLEVSSSWIGELVFHTDSGNLVFRTSEGLPFVNEMKENKFCQVLKEGPWMFIKIPDRDFREANYTGLYSPDVRYDEYRPADKYFIMGSDSVFHRVQLTRRSLSKLFPSKSKVINSNLNENSKDNLELQVIRLLEKF